MRNYLRTSAVLLSLWTLLSLSLACTTTRTMLRPLSDANRAALGKLQSHDWEIEYRSSVPKEISEVARANADTKPRADDAPVKELATKPRADDAPVKEQATKPRADDAPLKEQATKPRLDGELLRFTSVGGQSREVPIDVVRSIQVVDHVQGATAGAFLGALVGGGLGFLIGFASGNRPPPHCDVCGFETLGRALDEAGSVALQLGLIGLGTGLIVGAHVGYREVVEFADRRP